MRWLFALLLSASLAAQITPGGGGGGGTGTVTQSGTTVNAIPRMSSATNLVNSAVTDNGVSVIASEAIGTTGCLAAVTPNSNVFDYCSGVGRFVASTSTGSYGTHMFIGIKGDGGSVSYGTIDAAGLTMLNGVSGGAGYVNRQASTVTATPGTNITSVTCATAACTTERGTYTIVGGTATTGTIATLAWTATSAAWVCTTSQNGGNAYLGIGHSVATTTGMNITAAVAVTGLTVTVDYSCKP